MTLLELSCHTLRSTFKYHELIIKQSIKRDVVKPLYIQSWLPKRSLTSVLSHFQFAQRFHLSTICREQFH